MRTSCFRYVYGSVRSRRLGRSLGIDLVPFKTCTYDCVYCQLGRTTEKTLKRRRFIAVEEILAELEWRLAETDIPDYITLAGSGEPTLNSGIGDLTGMPSEAMKIAAFARRIGASRVQLNTAYRPPAENFAFPLSIDRMRALKDCFPDPVDIIGETGEESAHVPGFAPAGDVDILALLGRRPCTSADVASGLGIHVTVALKRLDALIMAGKVTTVLVAGRTFYTFARWMDASEVRG